jgi:bacteriorhodopsin
MAFLPPSNDVLSINPPNKVDIALSVQGSDWLWAVTAVYIVAFVSYCSSHMMAMDATSLSPHALTLFPPLQFGCLVPSFTSHESKRVFNYMLAICLLAGAASYYAQASDLG